MSRRLAPSTRRATETPVAPAGRLPRTLVVATLAWLLAVGPLSGCSPGQAPDAPALTLTALDGSTYELDAGLDKPVLLVFFAINNPLAIDELERLEAFTAGLPDPGIELVAVARSDERPELVRTIAHQHGFLFPVAMDTAGEAASALKVTATPAAFLVSADGALIYSVTGPSDLDTLRATIASH